MVTVWRLTQTFVHEVFLCFTRAKHCCIVETVGVFQYGGDTLKKLINKDVVTPEIQESRLSAEHIGQAQMKVFVDNRLCEPPDSDHHLNLKAPIQRNKVKTCILHCNHAHVETIIVAV